MRLAFALALIFMLRPGITLLATLGGHFKSIHRFYWAWFGIRGIGSIYYMSYALDSGVEEPETRTLFAITLGTILASSAIHGLSVRPFLERFEGAVEVEE